MNATEISLPNKFLILIHSTKVLRQGYAKKTKREKPPEKTKKRKREIVKTTEKTQKTRITGMHFKEFIKLIMKHHTKIKRIKRKNFFKRIDKTKGITLDEIHLQDCRT